MFTINELLEKKFVGIRYKNAVYKKADGVLELTLEYVDGIFDLNEDNINLIEKEIKELLGYDIKIDFNFNKLLLDEDMLLTKLFLYLKNDFPALSKYLTTNDIILKNNGGIDIQIEISLPKHMKDYAVETEKNKEIAEKIKKDFFCNPTIIFVEKQIKDNNSIEKNKEFLESTKIPQINTIYNLNNKVNVLGKNNYNIAIDFSKINEPVKNVIICGKVRYIEQKTFKRKRKNQEGNEEVVDSTYFSILIAEKNKSIYASVFCSENDVSNLSNIQTGMSIGLKGNFNIFKDKMSFVANEICMCEYSIVSQDEEYKSANKDYHIVNPVSYHGTEQIDIFNDEIEYENCNLTETYCVFDVETTGLEPETEEIIEIGACKIENGKIVSTFQTLVKPTKIISSEITNLTGIDNSMVADSPDIISVFPDFYKYADGCVLVAHNIDFDYKFMNKVAKKMYYRLDNDKIDTLSLAKSKIRGLKNYKLNTIAEHLNIVNPNAHRALSDALTAAKLLIKLY